MQIRTPASAQRKRRSNRRASDCDSHRSNAHSPATLLIAVAVAFALLLPAAADAGLADELPADHWAHEALAQLEQAGIGFPVEGRPTAGPSTTTNSTARTSLAQSRYEVAARANAALTMSQALITGEEPRSLPPAQRARHGIVAASLQLDRGRELLGALRDRMREQNVDGVGVASAVESKLLERAAAKLEARLKTARSEWEALQDACGAACTSEAQERVVDTGRMAQLAEAAYALQARVREGIDDVLREAGSGLSPEWVRSVTEAIEPALSEAVAAWLASQQGPDAVDERLRGGKLAEGAELAQRLRQLEAEFREELSLLQKVKPIEEAVRTFRPGDVWREYRETLWFRADSQESPWHVEWGPLSQMGLQGEARGGVLRAAPRGIHRGEVPREGEREARLGATIPIPGLGGRGEVEASYAIVDVDRLRKLVGEGERAHGDPVVPREIEAGARDVEQQLSLAGRLSVGEDGSIKIGYQVRQSGLEALPSNLLDGAIGADLEYRLSERAKVNAGLRWHTADRGAAAGLGIGYRLGESAELSARYSMVRFDDGDGEDYWTDLGEAELVVRF